MQTAAPCKLRLELVYGQRHSNFKRTEGTSRLSPLGRQRPPQEGAHRHEEAPRPRMRTSLTALRLQRLFRMQALLQDQRLSRIARHPPHRLGSEQLNPVLFSGALFCVKKAPHPIPSTISYKPLYPWGYFKVGRRSARRKLRRALRHRQTAWRRGQNPRLHALKHSQTMPKEGTSSFRIKT